MDRRSKCELKIGVCTEKYINLNEAFCDHSYGYAYYGLAQLRHNSGSCGPKFGESFLKRGYVGNGLYIY